MEVMKRRQRLNKGDFRQEAHDNNLESTHKIKLNLNLLYQAKTLFSHKPILICFLICFSIYSILFVVDFLFSSNGILFQKDGSQMIISPDAVESFPSSLSVSPFKSFVVIINTYKRPEMLKLAVNHYAKTCGKEFGISQVFVVWAELSREPPLLDEIFGSDDTSSFLRHGEVPESHKSNRAPVNFIRVPKDSLNSRFLPIKGLKNDAVFMIDDDVQVQCTSLSMGFEAWRHNSNVLVGYYPRLASPSVFSKVSDSNATHGRIELVYHTWPIVFARDKFNFILTKASFFHKKYLQMYFDPAKNPKEILEYVDEHKNCEDIAMAFLIAKTNHNTSGVEKFSGNSYCQNCPVYVPGALTDLGLFNGISTTGGHMEERSGCLTTISGIYQNHGWKNPLLDVGLRDQSWIHHYPGFRWQSRPSNIFEWLSIGNMLQ